MTVEHVLNHVKKTHEYGNDASESLRKLEKVKTSAWEPTLEGSTKTDPDQKKTEERRFELKHKAELDEAMRRTKKFESNLCKAHAELWERCSKSVKLKLEARNDFKSDVHDDPISLLKAIKEHSLNCEETRCDMRIIANAFEAYFNCKQKENESLQDYTKRFKIARDVLHSHLRGVIRMHKIIKNDSVHDENDSAVVKHLEEIVDERFAACMHLKNASQEKHGSSLNNLNSQMSLKNDQFPTKLVDTNNALDNHEWDKNRNKFDKDKNKNNNNDTEKDTPLSFVQNEDAMCFKCGSKGHRYPTCPKDKKNKLQKSEWWINQPGNSEKFEQWKAKRKV